MKKIVISALLLAVGLTLGSGMALGSEQVKKAEDSATADLSVAISALNLMSAHLRSLDSFIIEGSATSDEVLANGQKVQISRSLRIKADPPAKLWANSSNMYSNQEFFFDGKTFTISTPDLGYYASFDAPATIGEVVLKAKEKFNVDIPLSDLFLWGSTLDAATEMDEAIIVGVDQIHGIQCNQFAFRGQELDWQIWIQRDGRPLPLKLVITSKLEESQPQYAVVLKWNTEPTLGEQTFSFTPAENDKKITLVAAKEN